ncbi:hypothetical protein BGZ94_007811 [Podila epigama]|nr:hypothetical protein BGZ94_007811 [Podila epigama]
MRVANLAVLLLCLSVIRAQQEQVQVEQQQQQQQEQQQQQQEQSQQQPQQQAFEAPAPASAPASEQFPRLELTNEEIREAREGIKKILAQLPVHTVEPLVLTGPTYCKAFENLCNLSCEERLRITSPEETAEEDEGVIRRGCANPDAASVFHAAALCQCAGIDMTDRINFALVGGITSKTSANSDFATEGLLDGLTFLPYVSGAINLIQTAQKACHFVGYLKFLTDGTPIIPIPKIDGGIFDTIKNLFGGGGGGGGESSANKGGSWFDNLFPKPQPVTSSSCAAPTPTSTGGGGGSWWDNFWGVKTSGAPAPTVAPTTAASSSAPEPTFSTVTKSGGGGWFFDDLFGKKTTTLVPTVEPTRSAAPLPTSAAPVSSSATTAAVVSTTAATSAITSPATSVAPTTTAASPTPKPTGWFFGWLNDVDENGNLITPPEGDMEGEEAGEQDGAHRLISRDGRVARIVRVQHHRADKDETEEL